MRLPSITVQPPSGSAKFLLRRAEMKPLRIEAAGLILIAGCVAPSETVAPSAPPDSARSPEGRIGLARPARLADGEACLGVLAQVRPGPGAGELPYWGCFPNGAIDQAYTPGVVESVPLEAAPAPTSAVPFDSGELEGLESKDLEELDRSDEEVRERTDRSGERRPTTEP
jgi:hypothetical protein